MNIFTLRKLMSLFMTGLLPMATLVIMLMIEMDLMIAFASYILMLIIMVAVSHFFVLNHPYFKMLEGQGLLVFTFDSLGKIDCFNVNINLRELVSKSKKHPVRDIWDRGLAFTISPPKTVNVTLQKGQETDIETNKFIHVGLPLKDTHKYLFNFENRVALIYNRQLKCFMDKETMAEKESSLFAKHMIMLLKRRTEEQNEYLKSFHRKVVEESTKPKTEWWQNRWIMWIVIIVAVVFVAALGWPIISKLLEGVAAELPAAGGQIISAR